MKNKKSLIPIIFIATLLVVAVIGIIYWYVGLNKGSDKDNVSDDVSQEEQVDDKWKDYEVTIINSVDVDVEDKEYVISKVYEYYAPIIGEENLEGWDPVEDGKSENQIEKSVIIRNSDNVIVGFARLLEFEKGMFANTPEDSTVIYMSNDWFDDDNTDIMKAMFVEIFERYEGKYFLFTEVLESQEYKLNVMFETAEKMTGNKWKVDDTIVKSYYEIFIDDTGFYSPETILVSFNGGSNVTKSFVEGGVEYQARRVLPYEELIYVTSDAVTIKNGILEVLVDAEINGEYDEELGSYIVNVDAGEQEYLETCEIIREYMESTGLVLDGSWVDENVLYRGAVRSF